MGFCAYLEVPHRILGIFGSSSWNFVHFCKFFKRFCAVLDVPRGILCIFGSSSWDCAYLRVPHRIVYILEVHHGILCIIGSQSRDYVHFWKFLMGFCAFLEFPHGKRIHVSISSFHFFQHAY